MRELWVTIRYGYITFDYEKHISVFFFHFKFNKRAPSLYARLLLRTWDNKKE